MAPQHEMPSDAQALRILEGARRAFLDEGYEGASLESIARRIGASKATIYRQFPDKAALFRAMVELSAAAVPAALHIDLRAEIDTRTALLELVQRFLALCTSRDSLAFHRMVVAQVTRFPELGNAVFDFRRGGAPHLATGLQLFHDAGRLRLDDVTQAALQLWGLSAAYPYMLAVLRPEQPLSGSERRRFLSSGVDAFLRLFPPLT